MVTSTEQEEGKTTVAANLAVVMAEANKKILLIDGDLRRATAGKFFTTYSNRAAGLSTLLSNLRSEPSEAIQSTQVKGLDFLPAGPIPHNRTKRNNLVKCKTLLKRSNARLIGFVYNGAKSVSAGNYKYYKY